MVPLPNHKVTKNLTGHKMHEVGPQISQINPYNNVNMQIYRLARKIRLVKKSKNDLFLDTNLGFLTLEGPGHQTVDTRSTSGVPLKTLGHNGSN